MVFIKKFGIKTSRKRITHDRNSPYKPSTQFCRRLKRSGLGNFDYKTEDTNIVKWLDNEFVTVISYPNSVV